MSAALTQSKPKPAQAAMVTIESSRAAQEVQAAMIVAKRHPRDDKAALDRILKSCRRTGLAEQAVYEYPRGGTNVTGPSIRLAESMAQNWGNLDFGIVELEQRHGESTVQAYAWDLETNVRQTKTFQVRHERHTKEGSKKLTDPRDIYELTANQGARRLRACILGVIPGDIVDAALAECEKTLRLQDKSTPIGERVEKMVSRFASLGVDADAIARRIGKPLTEATDADFASLLKIYNVLSDNLADKSAFFSGPAEVQGEGETKSEQLADRVKKAKKAEKAADGTLPLEGEPENDHPDAKWWRDQCEMVADAESAEAFKEKLGDAMGTGEITGKLATELKGKLASRGL